MFVLESGREAARAIAPNPEFGLVGETAVRLPPPWHNRETARYLAARVARKPGDLLCHMRRIWLHRDMHDEAGTVGAAIDLFIATQNKGRELRLRILDTFARELRACDCYQALREALDGALSHNHPAAAHGHSVLCRPVSGGFDFVRDVRYAEPGRLCSAGQIKSPAESGPAP